MSPASSWRIERIRALSDRRRSRRCAPAAPQRVVH